MQDLPASVREIAEVIGRQQALFLIGQLPRCYVDKGRASRVILYVPHRLPPDHRLVEILGWHDALKLVKAFGGEILQPANCAFIYKRWRDESIRRLKRLGHTTEDIAQIVRVSRRKVNATLAASGNGPGPFAAPSLCGGKGRAAFQM